MTQFLLQRKAKRSDFRWADLAQDLKEEENPHSP
jgi:hypothetical protein